MAKFRYVNTRFWDDSYIADLSPLEKLAFLYLLTNSLTTIAGVYELPIKKAAFDVGISPREATKLFAKFEADGKLVRHGTWIGIKNFIKHQSLNPKVRRGIENELARAPDELVERLDVPIDLVPTDHDRLSHSNPNPNFNSKRLFSPDFSTGRDADLEERIRKLARKKSV